ncbi:MAG: GTP cyclohydrolase I FolE [Candidatus Hydrogenedentota bacterium]|nr:MAG: GTP cyclohydrolase I FolE [Candidatus Hydrogenedentota bacterium]
MEREGKKEKSPCGKDCSERRRRIAKSIREILETLGFDIARSDLRDTPSRVAEMYWEIFRGEREENEPKLTVFPNDEGYRSMVMVRDIPFYSMCAHHLVPFFGVGHIGYIPAESIVGLSKLARVLEHFARRPQVQERLTEQVADFLQKKLNPRGVMVVLEARHLCMEMRGVEKPGALTMTTTTRGTFDVEEGVDYRKEFLRHLLRPGSVPR